jgi:hypothetical protein
MADIINLRRARKAKTRADAAAEADANRLKHGQTKAAKTARRADEQRASKTLDAHRLDTKSLDTKAEK